MRRASRYRALSVILVALGMLVAITAAPAAASHQGTPDRDCSDFSTQAAAQDYFEAHGGPTQDPDQLDADGDGLACESNSCPCRGVGQPTPAPSPTPVPEPTPTPEPPPEDVTVTAVIVRVIDGDTIVARTEQGEVTVRLIGIDTPETKKPGTPVECGGPQATKVMRRFASVGEEVRLTTDSTQDATDRFGRLLAYVTGDNGRLLQVETLKTGWARVFVFEQRFKRYRQFVQAQRSAKRARRGVFRRCGGRIHSPQR